MNFRRKKPLMLACIFFANSSAFASNSFDIRVDTQPLANSDGYLYFQYIPVDGADSTAAISNFSTDGVLGQQDLGNVINGGAVTGTLANDVAFTNTNGDNDYNQAIHFGNQLGFLLSFSDPLAGSLAGGSIFSLGLFSDALGDKPLITGDGTLFSASLINDGSVITYVNANNVQVKAVPLPSASWILVTGLIGLAGISRSRC